MPIEFEVRAGPSELIRRGRELFRRSEYAQARALAERAVAAGDGSADPLLILAGCARIQGEHPEALAHALTAADRARLLGDVAGESRACAEAARVLASIGETADALPAGLRAVDLAEACPDPSTMVVALTAVGNVYLALQQLDLARQACERAAGIAQRIGDEISYGALLDTIACVLLNQADIARMSDDDLTAISLALEATDRSRAAMLIARRLGHRRNEATALLNLAEGLVQAGRPEEALRLVESWPIDLDRGTVTLADHVLDTRGFIYLELGRHQEAIECFAQAVELAEGSTSAMMSCERLAEAYERNGDPVAALAAYKRYHQLFREVASETAQRNARVAAVRLETEQSKALAEQERRRADGLQHSNLELGRQVLEDPLTGLANRRAFDDRLAAATAVLLVDVDHFKQVNDRYTHQVGDAVLRRVADLLRAGCREGDLAARYGGEEFAMLLHDVSADEAAATAERVRRSIEEYAWDALVPGLVVTVSIGVAVGGEADPLAVADRRLYEAKNAGRNRVVSAGGPGSGRTVPPQR